MFPKSILYRDIALSDERFVLNRVDLHRSANDLRLLTIPPSWEPFQLSKKSQSVYPGSFKKANCTTPMYDVSCPHYSPIMICIHRSDKRSLRNGLHSPISVYNNARAFIY